MSIKNQIYLVGLSLLLVANYFCWQAVVLASDHNLHIYFLDVGQGDSVLIRTPDRKNILVDGGPDESVVYQLFEVLPIWDRDIDLMVLTHPQADHVTGLIEVLDRFKVKEILATFAEYPTKTNQEWLDKTSQYDCVLNWADASDDYYFGDVFWDTLWPIDVSENPEDINEDSVVGKIRYHNWSLLLTGDIGFETEEKIINTHYDIDVDVLKVGHHGSRYASSKNFLIATTPQISVITVGKNSYGHPAEETINRLINIGAEVYRTDLQGRVEIEVSKTGIVNISSQS